ETVDVEFSKLHIYSRRKRQSCAGYGRKPTPLPTGRGGVRSSGSQKLSFALLRAANVATASPPPQRACMAGSSARRKGLAASSRSSLVGTVHLSAARRAAT